MVARMRGWTAWALVCIAGACGGGDDGGGDGASADSGSGGAADASGAADGGRPDASSLDGGDPDGALADARTADAGGPDAAAGPGVVSFTVIPGTPWSQAGQRVFFLRADDSVVDIVLTDENGRAEAIFDEPGTIVADLRLDEPGSSAFILAHLGVAPGSDLRHWGATPDRSGTLVATGPAPEMPFGFGLETRCGRGDFGNPGVPIASINLAFCPPVIDVVWVAGGTIDGQEGIFSVYQPSVPVDAGSITITGTLRRDLVQSTRMSGIPEAASYTNMLYRMFGTNGLVVLDRGPEYDVPVNEGASVLVHPMHDLTGLGLRGWVYASWSIPLSGTTMEVGATVLHDGSPNVNVAAVLPPALRDSVFDRATGVWTWTEEGPNTPTAIDANISLVDPDLPRSWRIVAPGQGGSIRVPRLPPPYDDLNVAADTNVYSAQLNSIGHSRGYAPVVANIAGSVFYEAGEVGDITAVAASYVSVVQ